MTAATRNIQDDGRVFIDMAESDDNPCLHCGLCCSSFRVSFYFGETDNFHGHIPLEMTSKVNDFYACMKGTEQGCGKCTALQGDAQSGTIRCSIYANRPTPCREFPVWMEDGSINAKCNELRAKFGIRTINR